MRGEVQVIPLDTAHLPSTLPIQFVAATGLPNLLVAVVDLKRSLSWDSFIIKQHITKSRRGPSSVRPPKDRIAFTIVCSEPTTAPSSLRLSDFFEKTIEDRFALVKHYCTCPPL